MSDKRAPTKYFVTRHRGAITWASEGGVKASKIEMENFDVLGVRAGDVVMGTLPVHLAAEVCERGGQYWHLVMDIPPSARGRELTAKDMRDFGAGLEAFLIQGLGTRLSATPEVDGAPDSERRVLHVCIVTAETMANLLPLMHLQWDDVALIVSDGMKDQGKHLATLALGVAESRGRSGAAMVVSKSLPRTTPLHDVRAGMASIAAELREEFPDHVVVLNWTGGLKLMALGALEAFRPFARLFYCDTKSEMLEAVWPPSNRSEPIPPMLTDVETYLFAQRYQIARMKDLSAGGSHAMERRRRVTATLMLDAHRHQTGAAFGSPANPQLDRFLHDLARRALPREERRNQPGQLFSPMQFADGIEVPTMALVKTLDALVNAEVLARWRHERSTVTIEFTNEAMAAYLAGGYAEEFVVLSMLCLGLPGGQVASNVGIDVLRPSKSRRRDELNELDAVLVWRNKILLVECKAGLQLQQGQSQEALNKLAALRNMVGALGEAWLVSKVPLSPKYNADALDRMDMYGIRGIAGAKTLHKLPIELARWAKVEPGEGLIDWNAEVLPVGRP